MSNITRATSSFIQSPSGIHLALIFVEFNKNNLKPETRIITFDSFLG